MRDGFMLAAGDVRAQLFESVAPVYAALTNVYGHEADDALLVIQLRPTLVQVIRRPTSEKPASLLAVVSGESLPPRLTNALQDAVQAFAAGILSTIPPTAAEKAIDYAASAHDRGLCVVVDVLDGSAELVLAAAGRPFSEAVTLGAVADMEPMRAN